jgi:hypothetical protein
MITCTNNKSYFSINKQVHTVLNSSRISGLLRILPTWQSACTPPRLYDKLSLAARSVATVSLRRVRVGMCLTYNRTGGQVVMEKKHAMKYT